MSRGVVDGEQLLHVFLPPILELKEIRVYRIPPGHSADLQVLHGPFEEIHWSLRFLGLAVRYTGVTETFSTFRYL